MARKSAKPKDEFKGRAWKPAKDKSVSFPKPKKVQQYDQPIGPRRQTTADRVREAAQGIGSVLFGAQQVARGNSRPQKALRSRGYTMGGMASGNWANMGFGGQWAQVPAQEPIRGPRKAKGKGSYGHDWMDMRF